MYLVLDLAGQVIGEGDATGQTPVPTESHRGVVHRRDSARGARRDHTQRSHRTMHYADAPTHGVVLTLVAAVNLGAVGGACNCMAAVTKRPQ